MLQRPPAAKPLQTSSVHNGAHYGNERSLIRQRNDQALRPSTVPRCSSSVFTPSSLRNRLTTHGLAPLPAPFHERAAPASRSGMRCARATFVSDVGHTWAYGCPSTLRTVTQCPLCRCDHSTPTAALLAKCPWTWDGIRSSCICSIGIFSSLDPVRSARCDLTARVQEMMSS
jgi:hypothetical protein